MAADNIRIAIKTFVRQLLHKHSQITEREYDRIACGLGFVSDCTPREEICSFLKLISPMTVTGMPLIRMGGQQDGGYLVPDDLVGVSVCLSPGVSDIADFEYECAQHGMTVLLADASVNNPPVSHEAFRFRKRFVGSFTTDQFFTLDDWLTLEGIDGNAELMLQMDIEGAEYETLLAVPTSLLKRFRIIVIEFHSLDQMWCMPFFAIASRVFTKLCAEHVPVHVHPNNIGGAFSKHGISIPPMCEITFLRKDRVKETTPVRALPHPLDRDNSDEFPSVKLGREWLAN